MRDAKGSMWSKWDLHVHTPSSLVHEYGGATEEVWERFIADLEALPSEFRVLGINDYLFIDGYRRLRDEKYKKNRLKNIDLLLPVIELRMAMFGGTTGPLRRINFHVIFSDQLDPDLIDQHFIRALAQHFLLSPEHSGLNWHAIATRESLIDLGTKIIASTPKEKQADFGSPLLEGFNNLNFEPAQLREVLESHYLRDHHLTAIGKTEWADIKWSDHSIAAKKTIINEVDLVFTAADTPATYHRARQSLTAAGVRDRLIDCSDAHRFSNSQDKDRVGNCFTWIKADTTFEGLLHVCREFDTRVFVGDLPDKLRLVRDAPSRFLESLEVKKTALEPQTESWFDAHIPLNPDLVAIIGNKGSGKSALADIVGLLGNTPHTANFSFLSAKRFREHRGEKARCFEGKLTLASGSYSTRTLDANPEVGAPRRVQYVPQQYLEHICNEITKQGGGEFDREIKQVIYSHVPDDERLEHERLDDVLRVRTSELERAITQLRTRLRDVNKEIVAIQMQQRPEHRSNLEKKLQAQKHDLDQHRQRKPQILPQPAATPDDTKRREEITKLQQRLSEFHRATPKVKAALEATTRQRLSLQKAREKILNLSSAFEAAKDEIELLLKPLGLDINQIVSLKADTAPLDTLNKTLADQKNRLELTLEPSNESGLPKQIRVTEEAIGTLQNQLDEPQRKYQASITALAQWTQREQELLGTITTPGTVLFLEQQIKDLDLLPEAHSDLRKKRNTLAEEIHGKILAITEVYRSLYGYAQRFIENHPVLKDKNLLRFSATIGDTGFAERFFQRIDQRTRTKFAGSTGSRSLDDMLSTADFNTWEGAKAFLIAVATTLAEGGLTAQDQLRRNESLEDFYDFLFSLEYLQPQYSLQLAGKPMSSLSPGERGTLLLIFYLIVDRSDLPIVIDQPEDNLDNHTIYTLLVPSIREAKRTRQIILVTHSPNLAVVCDAEQVICASYHADGVKLRYASGAIENPTINAEILTILEGTRPAFDNRRSKYQPFRK
jgi:ABC-type lipoprotein export system ATPase subunit